MGKFQKTSEMRQVCSARGDLTQQLLLGSGEESYPVGGPRLSSLYLFSLSKQDINMELY